MAYKIVYHLGESIDIKTVVASGTAVVNDTELQITGNDDFRIQFSNLTEVQLFQLHGFGRMVKVCHHGGTIFISVIRFKLFQLPVIGQFAIGNFFGTRNLFNSLRSKVA